MIRPLLLSLALLAPLAAHADEDAASAPPALPFSYEMFEASVPHTDMAVCPVDLAQPGVFCRVALFNDAFHIFLFTEEGDQPLVGFQSYDSELMTGLFD
ncbi:MAG: hypothetical protein R3D78_03980 [Paracoccaceae bacterium]